MPQNFWLNIFVIALEIVIELLFMESDFSKFSRDFFCKAKIRFLAAIFFSCWNLNVISACAYGVKIIFFLRGNAPPMH